MKRKHNRNNAKAIKAWRDCQIKCQIFGSNYEANITKVEAMRLIAEMDNDNVDSRLIYYGDYAMISEAD